MLISEVCSRQVCSCDTWSTVEQAAMRMRQFPADHVVVTKTSQLGLGVPIGVLGAADLVAEVLAQQIDPAAITLGELVHGPCISVNEETPVFEAISIMRKHRVRWLPVTSILGALIGLASSDALSLALAERHMDLARIGTSPSSAHEQDRA